MVQAPDEQQRRRLGEVEQFPGLGQDLVHVAQVSPDDGGRVVPGQQRLGVQEHHRVVVHVDHARIGVVGLCDLMHVRAVREAAADVDELADPGIAQEANCALQKLAITAHGVQDLRHHRYHLLGGGPVRSEVVLAAQPVVIHPGRVRDVCADVRRNSVPRPAWSGHSAPLAIVFTSR